MKVDTNSGKANYRWWLCLLKVGHDHQALVKAKRADHENSLTWQARQNDFVFTASTREGVGDLVTCLVTNSILFSFQNKENCRKVWFEMAFLQAPILVSDLLAWGSKKIHVKMLKTHTICVDYFWQCPGHTRAKGWSCIAHMQCYLLCLFRVLPL